MDIKLFTEGVHLLKKNATCYVPEENRIACPFNELPGNDEGAIQANGIVFNMRPGFCRGLEIIGKSLGDGFDSIELDTSYFLGVAVVKMYEGNGSMVPLGFGTMKEVGGRELPVTLRVSHHTVAFCVREEIGDRVYEAKAEVTFGALESAIQHADQMAPDDVEEAMEACIGPVLVMPKPKSGPKPKM